jgi:hypothetical protein
MTPREQAASQKPSNAILVLLMKTDVLLRAFRRKPKDGIDLCAMPTIMVTRVGGVVEFSCQYSSEFESTRIHPLGYGCNYLVAF